MRRNPHLPPLSRYLAKLARGGDFVHPELAAMYKANKSGISYRVRKFLEAEPLMFKTTKKIEGRDRAVSVLDVHSLRHTFCYLCGVYNVPMSIVQSVVGHMDEGMTRQYMAHVSDQDKIEHLRNLPDFLVADADEPSLSASPKEKLLTLLRSSADLNAIRDRLLAAAEEV